MSFRIEVTIDPLGVEVDALQLIAELAEQLPQHYIDSFRRGQRPEGGAMPLNKRGKPIGVGSGTIANNWVTTPPSGGKLLASFETGPYTDGGYFYPIRRLVELGSNPVSAEGLAGALINAAVSRAADRAVGL